MASKYQEVIDAVLAGQVVKLSALDTSVGSLRTTLGRALKELQLEERTVGVNLYGSKQISVVQRGSSVIARLTEQPTISFTILEDDEDGT